ncbi:universal stress protein [Kribbella sp. NPDC004536]|uniref:universal stress protein n=1 Tax=Kribbella sp. NPDC004536 TaxID=3364106 RepID=UPI00369BC1F3
MTQVVVLLEQDNQDALEWAAAEAAARRAELRVVYAFRWPYLLDALGELTVEERDLETAEVVVDNAIEHVRKIFPSLQISSTVFPGRAVDALLSEAEDGALLVISRGHRFERKLSRRLARRTKASLAVVGLTPHRTVGPSSGRVVVAVDGLGSDALGFAFGAARRRGTGLTVLQTRADADCVAAWRTAYPEVDVRCGTADGASAVLAESTAAALTVLTADRHWRRQTPNTDVARLASGPVVLV